ncbi:HMG-box domain-containing protein [bacterium]|nr:HMG-box domain-containing protein [bacterium]
MPPKKAIAKKSVPRLKGGKKAPTPYVVFCEEMRPKIVKANPAFTFGEVGKALGAAWGKLSQAEKDTYKSVKFLEQKKKKRGP